VIYLDASAVLARIFAEDRCPPDEVWDRNLAASRLLQYEVWNRIHARGRQRSHEHDAETFLGRVEMIDLAPHVLARALQPFPLPVRTLDGLHLATMDFLRRDGEPVELLSYDKRLLAAAEAMGIAAYRDGAI
jgi:predicted nucleic acid-binding protein